MCGQWGREGTTRKQGAEYIRAELPLNDLKSIVNNLSSFGPNMTLFGGEPLLYHDCADLIKYIKAKGMHCLMITNGSMLEGAAKDIVESGLDELNVSLDGNAELHDKIRGLPGLFDKITAGLKMIQKFKAEAKKKKPLINLQCAITKYNYGSLEQMTDVARDIVADSLTFHNLIFLSSGTLERQKEYDKFLGCGSADWEGFKFEPGIIPQELYKKIRNILSRKYGFSVDFYPDFSREDLIKYYNDSEYTGPGYSGRCLSPWIAAYIFPDGEVRPCLNLSFSYGNAVKTEFAKLWNNEKAVKFRFFLRQNRLFPVCGRCTELYRY